VFAGCVVPQEGTYDRNNASDGVDDRWRRVAVKTRVQRYPLADANRAIVELGDGRITGAAVMTI
jgi:hypothetical protein